MICNKISHSSSNKGAILKFYSCLLISLIFCLFIQNSSRAESLKNKEPIIFTADEVTNDDENNVIKARGNVEISFENNVLIADSITYNEIQDIVIATGNVSLLEPNGNVLFSEYIEISGDFKSGIIKNLRIRLSDNSRIAATFGRRTNGNRTEMINAVYSPCNGCGNINEGDPLWQVKATKVVHNQEKKQLEYYNSWMEMAGVPVMYMPYFTHPDPSVKRKSGFLTPSTGASTYLGSSLSTPYFYAISPSKDLTLTPTLTSKENAFLSGRYRQHFGNGELDSTLSSTFDSDNEFRGHVNSVGKFDINEKWRWGFNAHRSTDDTYLRLYKFPSNRTLTSRAFIEGFGSNNYLLVDGYSFQGTAVEDDRGTTPLVVPTITYNALGEPNIYGMRSSWEASSVVMTRSEGADTRRMSIHGDLTRPFVSKYGEIFNFSANINGDLYHVDSLKRATDKSNFTGFSYRLSPKLEGQWRLPLAKKKGSISETLEPRASIILSPYGGNHDTIPNEDSIDFEFDDTNLFGNNIFTGYDKIEGGPRASYGLKWGLIGDNGGHTSIFLGQRYRLKADSTFVAGSGLEENLSDFVARLNIFPNKYLDILYRTRLDKDNFSPKRNEFQTTLGPDALKVSANYIFFSSQNDQFSGREELSGSLFTKLNRNWSSGLLGRYDMKDDGDLRNFSVNLDYECECFLFSTSFKREFYQDRDIKPSDTVLFKLTFKTLGDVQTNL